MRKILVLMGLIGWLLLALWLTDVLAACFTNTYTGPDGRMIVCITCCTGSMCNTNCF